MAVTAATPFMFKPFAPTTTFCETKAVSRVLQVRMAAASTSKSTPTLSRAVAATLEATAHLDWDASDALSFWDITAP
jgi:hypothetical protein